MLTETLRLLTASLALAALFILTTVTPSLAAETHPLIVTFDDFVSNSGVAVDESNGNVFVADGTGGGESVKVFGSEGGPPTGVLTTEIKGFHFGFGQVTLAIDNSATGFPGDLYAADFGPDSSVDEAKIQKFGLNPTKEYEYLCQINGKGSGCTAVGDIGTPFFSDRASAYRFRLTVDTKGNLFVADELSKAVYEFGPGGEDLATIPIEPNGEAMPPQAIAVNSKGDLYVQLYTGNSDKQGIYVYKADASGEIEPGTEPAKFAPVGAAIAIDPANDHLYVAHGNHVSEYDASGELRGEFGKEVLVNPKGLAVNSQTGNVYVSSNPGVSVFGPSILVPDATTAKATNLARTSATLNGEIGAAGGPDATCVFQYVDDTSFKANAFKGAPSAPCDPAGPFTGSAMEKVKADVSGLTAGTVYHYRLLASNENGANENVNEPTLETPAAVQLQTGVASNAGPGAATLNGTVDPDGIELEECGFEYIADAAYQANLKAADDGFTGAAAVSCAETPAEIGSGVGSVPVHADVSGLSPGTVYHFRITAKNSFGTTKGAGYLFGPPRVSASSFSQITPTGATIRGLVNPDGVASTYVVQYVSEKDFSEGEWAKALSLPVGGAAIGSGIEDVEVLQQLTGLTPATTYRFRILAENASGSVEGPSISFTTYGAASGLPDGRAYEQVTPVDKNGAAPGGDIGSVQAARQGGAITYVSRGGIPGGEGAQKYPNYLASRGSNWSTQGLLPPASRGSVAGVLGWTEDLTKSYVVQSSLPGTPADFSQRDSTTGSLRDIVFESSIVDDFRFVGASTDGAVVIFESAKLSVGGVDDRPNLYAWNSATGQVGLVGVLNDEQLPAEGSLAGSNELGSDGKPFPSYFLQAQHTVASDGSRVFFNDPATGQLYLRQNPTQPQSALDGKGNCTEADRACTIQISASQRSPVDPNGPQDAVFWSATPDGSSAFFTSPGKLTKNATTGAKDEGNDLYRYDVATGALTDLTPDKVVTDPNGAEVRGVLGSSDDGSHVYFVANGVLSKTANARGEKAARGDCSVANPTNPGTGTCSLYLSREGEIDFIAPLQQLSFGSSYENADSANWRFSGPNPGGATTSRVSSDGETLLFRSQLALTGHDNDGLPEFYRYSAQDEDLSCVSCNPTGAAPTGAARLRSIETSGEFGVLPAANVLTRNLSANGNRVFFETPDKLVAGDTNGDGGCLGSAVSGGVGFCQDVYEWEAAGEGTCSKESPAYAASSAGCLYLLSSGTSPEASFFADADVDGANAFIFTAQPLVGQDQDQILDIYDARIGGGIASQNPPPPPPLCSSSEACRPGAAVPPAVQSPGSSSFSGPGNQKASQQKKKRKKSQHKKKKQQKKRHSVRRQG